MDVRMLQQDALGGTWLNVLPTDAGRVGYVSGSAAGAIKASKATHVTWDPPVPPHIVRKVILRDGTIDKFRNDPKYVPFPTWPQP